MIRRRLFALGAGCALLAHGAAAADLALGDPHLSVVTRTADEAVRIAQITTPATMFDAPEPFEAKSAGAATVRARPDSEAFSQSAANLTFEQELTFKLGNGWFKKLWVSSPSSTLASDGLGPLYNARACQRCHLKDGRGHPPETSDDSAVSMVLRVSVPAFQTAQLRDIDRYLAALDGDQATPPMRPDPVYGAQIQDVAVQGFASEGKIDIRYSEQPVTMSGGDTVWLRKPDYAVVEAGYGALSPEAVLSARVANPMIGLGLLDAISTDDILAHADPDDANGDGISGRAQIVWSDVHDQPMLGRFGWKAGSPSVLEQSAAAFSSDIGISTPLVPDPAGDCTALQPDCVAAIHGDGDVRGTEIDAAGLDLVAFYASNLGVPARRDVDDTQVLRGKAVFYETGCAACHVPKYVTARLAGEAKAAQSFQLIWPYSDLLLHDMGEGLADNGPEGRATGREWRTAPLWGIGLTRQVSGHTYFLHDGRARSLLEAVLWHGGEAQKARDTVIQMDPTQRNALLRFLESL
ncbi:di-heme oxidoredictase family protein [Celeribacter marinus]|uniref:di-heme oxidoreductase family protein n=1 Tax=Celeribacter marinus TaxID=1397108 RepID=UPI003181F4FE